MYVEPSANKQLSALIGAIDNPKHGDLVMSDLCLIKTCEWYIGIVCAEYDKKHGWIYQPYERRTKYTKSKEEAKTWLDLLAEL